MRTLGIDFGSKRIGVAISDENGLIAHGLKTILRSAEHHELQELQAVITDYRVDRLVVGLPRNMNGSLGPAAQQVLSFVEILKAKCAVPVDTWDERLSTAEAERLLIHADMSRNKRRKIIDKVAATIILQSYLDYSNLKNSVQ